MNNNTIVPVKQAIIGKVWANGSTIVPANFVLPSDMTFTADQSFLIGSMSFRTDRNLSKPLTVAAGQKLFFYRNTKREGKEDADYSVSVLLPVAEADEVIENSKRGAENWRLEHPVEA